MSQHPSPARDLIWCVIPTFNNPGTLRDIAIRSRAQLRNVVVVDDGSTNSDVVALLDGVDVTLLQHDKNRGKGQAILTALDFVSARSGRFLITLDADGQLHPEDITKFVEAVRQDDAAIIVGCRNFSAAPVPRASRFGRAFSNFWLRVETGEVIADSQCGFRAYPVTYLLQLAVATRHFDFEIEVLTRAAWAGLRLRSVDVKVWYPSDPTTRVSSFRPVLDNLRLFLIHARLVGRQLLPWPHRKLVRRQHRWRFAIPPRTLMMSLVKEHDTPGGLAAAAGLGVFCGVLPLIAAHILVIGYIAGRLNLNKVMALGIQHLCMPPFVPVACIELGHYLRYRKWLTEASLESVVHQITDRLYEWLLGSLVLAPVLACVAAVAVYCIARFARRRPIESCTEGKSM